MQITQTRYKYEVETFVWDFLLRVVVTTLLILNVFTGMSDQFLGLSPMVKCNYLVPVLGITAAVFVLQVGIMMVMHGVVSPEDYRNKSRVVFTVACLQFLCALFGLFIFVSMLDSHPRSSTQIFYWLVALGLAAWNSVWFVKYVFDIQVYTKTE